MDDLGTKLLEGGTAVGTAIADFGENHSDPIEYIGHANDQTGLFGLGQDSAKAAGSGSVGAVDIAGGVLGGLGGGVTAITEGINAAQEIKRGDYVGGGSAALASAAGAAQAGLSIAGAATSVAPVAAPIMGTIAGAINTGRGIYGGVKAHQAKKALDTKADDMSLDPAKKNTAEMAQYASGIQQKVKNRQKMNAVAGGIQVAGGIVAAGSAAATAGAGVAVGGAISAAGSLVKPGAKLVRYLKQKGRDKAEKETDPDSRWKKVFDEKKSTQNKDQEYQDKAAEIFAARADPDMQDIFKNLPKVTSKESELYQAGKLDVAAIEKILRRRD